MATESRVSRLEGAYEQIDERLGDLNDSVNTLANTIDSSLNILTIAMVTLGAALVGLHTAEFLLP